MASWARGPASPGKFPIFEKIFPHLLQTLATCLTLLRLHPTVDLELEPAHATPRERTAGRNALNRNARPFAFNEFSGSFCHAPFYAAGERANRTRGKGLDFDMRCDILTR